jgi:dienelactone hydrolase
VNLKAVGAIAVALLLVTSACSGSGHGSSAKPSGAASSSIGAYPLGTFTTTWVDTSRPTEMHGTTPGAPVRIIRTQYVYPAATGRGDTPALNAAPDRLGGPYPLVVFSHGFGSSPVLARDQINALASSGFVVAAPWFPLTNQDTPGGPDGADVTNQPADVSFVVTKTLQLAHEGMTPLAGLVNTREIAAGGHSAGAVTTLGFTNTCCKDARIKVLFAWAGNETAYTAKFDDAHAPPILFVHGTKDTYLPYNDDARSFNRISAPKAFLTMVGADHASWASKKDRSFRKVLTTTIDFLNVYLRHSAAAKSRLEQGEDGARYKLDVAFGSGNDLQVSELPTKKHHRKATVSQATGLQDGQTVFVAWRGFTPKESVHVVQCSGTGHDACDVTRGRLFVPDPKGSGYTTLTVHTGLIGDGLCLPGSTGCQIVVNDAASPDPSATLRIPISFAPPPMTPQPQR